MADNVVITGSTPTGAAIAADDIGGVLHQRVKLEFGADGAAADVSTANPLPISDAGGSLTIDAAALPLPSGAATAAKQPALGTAGAPSSDVLTVQGVASMTALKVDGSASTQPVSGTFWQGTQPVSLASLPALAAGGAVIGAVTQSGAWSVGGDVAAASADSGNPVKIGGKFSSTLPTLTNGQRGDLQLTAKGSAFVTLVDTAGTAPTISAAAGVDGGSDTANVLLVRSYGELYNGATWDRARSASAGMNSAGAGIFAAGLVAQLDDTTPTTITENQFGHLRMTSERFLYVGAVGFAKTVTPSAYGRPADTNAYAVDDCWSTATSGAANITFSSVNRISGKSVRVTSLVVVGSVHNATAPLQAELWLFDSAPTAVNDNANHALSDADAARVVAVIPFTLNNNMANNDVGYVSNIGFTITPVATDLIGQVRVKNAYVPSSAETLTFRLQVEQID